jgi:hypothetical protein
MKRLLLCILLILPFVPAMAHASNCSTTVGGIAVVVPVPLAKFTEVGIDKHDFFEWLVPTGNRLLCAFVPVDLLPTLKKPAMGMDRYMLVETVQSYDDAKKEVPSADFEEIITAVKAKLGDTKEMNQIIQPTGEELNRKLKAIDDSKDVSLDQPSNLGTIFQSPNVYAFAMIVPVTSAGTTKRVINASVLLRVRDRLVFAYIYASGGDQTSLQWTQQTASAWAQQILASNTN